MFDDRPMMPHVFDVRPIPRRSQKVPACSGERDTLRHMEDSHNLNSLLPKYPVHPCADHVYMYIFKRALISRNDHFLSFHCLSLIPKNRPHNERNFPQSRAISRKRARIWKVVVFKSSCTWSRNQCTYKAPGMYVYIYIHTMIV